MEKVDLFRIGLIDEEGGKIHLIIEDDLTDILNVLVGDDEEEILKFIGENFDYELVRKEVARLTIALRNKISEKEL